MSLEILKIYLCWFDWYLFGVVFVDIDWSCIDVIVFVKCWELCMVCMWYGVVVIDWFVSDVMVCCVIGVLKVVLNVVVEWEWLVCVLVMKCVKVVLKCICWLMLVEVEWLFVELFVYFVDMVCFSFEIGLWCVNVIGL